MSLDADALVIGAGPAGSAAAVLLARAGWRVLLVEQHAFPRQKVCGECMSAGSLTLIDQLGVGAEFRRLAGPELRHIAWMSQGATVTAAFPPCTVGDHRYGRALGRDHLDSLLLGQAQAVGVEVLQPAKVRSVGGTPGNMQCVIEDSSGESSTRTVRIVVDAHGSWEPEPQAHAGPEAVAAQSMLDLEVRPGPKARRDARPARDGADLFGFKALFRHTSLVSGVLPVLAFPGGYGGMVVADHGRTTLACCIRRDTLKGLRAQTPGVTASAAVAEYLLRSCRGVREAMNGAERQAQWLSVGPLRPGIRLHGPPGTFRVGNAAGETHPLIGEGINMALQSAALLVRHLLEQPPAGIDAPLAGDVNRRYAAAWRRAFTVRLRFAAGYARIAMRPAMTTPAHALLQYFPALLTQAARVAGKSRAPIEVAP